MRKWTRVKSFKKKGTKTTHGDWEGAVEKVSKFLVGVVVNLHSLISGKDG